ncbi:MAG: ABC transporter permease [Vicinamibacterales bacterium]
MKSSSDKKTSWHFFVFFIPVFLWILLMFVMPQGELLRLSFLVSDYSQDEVIKKFSIENYYNFFLEPIYWRTFVRTAIFSVLVTLIDLVVALPVAFFITKVVGLKYKGLILILVMLPFWVSGLIRIYGWITLLRESGVLNTTLMSLGILSTPLPMVYNDVSMILCLSYTTILYMIVPIIGVMDSLDDSYIEAAYDLGAKKAIVWFKIIIPHCVPGIVSGSIIVFMYSMGSYMTPKLVGGKNSLWFTEQIYDKFIHSDNWNQGAAFGLVLLVVSSVFIGIALKLSKQKFSTAVAK